MAAEQAGAYREQDWVVPIDHAEARLRERTNGERTNLRAVWHEAEPVHYPGADPEDYCRYHQESDLVIVAAYGIAPTVKRLWTETEHTQQYVREQVVDR